MALTEKMKDFCKEYINNGYNATQAYLTAYNGTSAVSARIEGSRFLQRDDISEYIQTLLKPSYNQALAEREQKRALIKSRIQACVAREDDAAAARWMDILNKMDSEYINISRIQDERNELDTLDTDTLKKITKLA